MATTTGGLKKREKTDFLKSVVFFKRSIWSKKNKLWSIVEVKK